MGVRFVTKSVLNVMAIYYIITGLWPMVHMRSFILITGPKVDLWLVRCLALMITSSGILFALPFLSDAPPSHEVQLLAMLNAFSLFVIDFYYPLKKRISKIYMVDGVLQVIFLGMLLAGK
jgi:hypothetical protein